MWFLKKNGTVEWRGTRGFGVKNRSDPPPPETPKIFVLINSNFLVFANFSKFGVRFSKQKLTGSTASFFTNSFALSSAQAQPSSGSVQLKCSRELWRALGKISINSVSNKRSADMKPANTWFSFWSMAWSFACVNFFINFVALGLDVNVRACGFDYEEENWVLKCVGKFLSWRIAGECTCSSPISQMSVNLVYDYRNKNLRVPPLVFFTNCRPQFCRPVPYSTCFWPQLRDICDEIKFKKNAKTFMANKNVCSRPWLSF